MTPDSLTSRLTALLTDSVRLHANTVRANHKDWQNVIANALVAALGPLVEQSPLAAFCQSEGPRGETICMLKLGHDGPCGWENPRLREAVLKVARDIGNVSTVAKRPSEPDAETRQMIARLDEWRSSLLDIADIAAEPAAPLVSPPGEPAHPMFKTCVYCKHARRTINPWLGVCTLERSPCHGKAVEWEAFGCTMHESKVKAIPSAAETLKYGAGQWANDNESGWGVYRSEALPGGGRAGGMIEHCPDEATARRRAAEWNASIEATPSAVQPNAVACPWCLSRRVTCFHPMLSNSPERNAELQAYLDTKAAAEAPAETPEG